jgi:CRP-like cAMP-binding protein
MANKPNRPRTKAPQTQALHGSDGNAVHNRLLLDLTGEDRKSVLSKLEFVQLPVQRVLNEMAEPIEHVYFINSGLASILNVMSNGKSVEVGLSGKEGFVGLPLIVGFQTSPTQVVMQIAGTGFRVSAKEMADILRRCPDLEKSLHRYSHELGLQTTQVAACNRLHAVDKRLARWLLMSQERVETPDFPLTQQFLAHMLGTRRASVTVAAGVLQRAGLITYKKGQVHIENRAALEKASCECYRHLNQQIKSWHKNSR